MTTSEPARLTHEVASIRPGAHLCLFYEDDPREQLGALVPFISQGLDQGERCIYVADDLTVFELHQALTDGGIDVLREMTRGALLLLTRADWRQPGELDADAKAAHVRAMIDEALAAGYKGVRFGMEMTWTLSPLVEAARLRHWEATLNTIIMPGAPVRVLCQYNRSRLAPDAVHAALITHPQAILGDGVYANRFYDALRCLDDDVAKTAPSLAEIEQLLRGLVSAPGAGSASG